MQALLNDTKFIVVTGGVCSGLGKGIASASIGALLKASGYNVSSIKFDPYLNVDPGTMSPFQHGEVFVTEDGAETDLDLGHYERFIDTNVSKYSSVSTGQIYTSVLEKERKGEYLGGTIQIIPHITTEIKDRVYKVASETGADIILIEIGGTVGDIEGEPFFEAMRQLSQEKVGSTMFVHLVLLPYLKASKELKTKPAQASVKSLRHIGIEPDMIIARADYKIGKELLDKLSLFSNVKREAVVPAMTSSCIYFVPEELEKYNVSNIVMKHLGLQVRKPDLIKWKDLSRRIKASKQVIRIGIAGKYNALEDAYMSVIESAQIAGYYNACKVEIVWIDAEELEKGNDEVLKTIHGCIVPGGFGGRGIEGKILVAKYARENNLPYLGLCLGSQIMAIEFARNILGYTDATSEEFDDSAKHQVIHIMEHQKAVTHKGGTMRLGSYDCNLLSGSTVQATYGELKVTERHRHRYEFNNSYRDEFQKQGFIISGVSPDNELVEMVELKDHPYMVGTQAHPEFKTRPHKAHPLFAGLVKAAVEFAKK